MGRPLMWCRMKPHEASLRAKCSVTCDGTSIKSMGPLVPATNAFTYLEHILHLHILRRHLKHISIFQTFGNLLHFLRQQHLKLWQLMIKQCDLCGMKQARHQASGLLVAWCLWHFEQHAEGICLISSGVEGWKAEAAHRSGAGSGCGRGWSAGHGQTRGTASAPGRGSARQPRTQQNCTPPPRSAPGSRRSAAPGRTAA